MNNRKTGLILSYSQTLLSMISGIFLSSFLIRSLGDYEYGMYQTMTAFVNYLVIFEFGTGTVMSRNILVAKNSGNKEQIQRSITTVLFITIFLAVIICLVGLVFWANIQNIYSKTIDASDMLYCKNMFLIMMVYLIASYLIQTLSGVFLGFENYVIGNIINIIQIATRIILIATFISLFKYSIVIAIVDMFVSSSLAIFALCYCIKKYKLSFEIKNFDKNILKTSLPFCLAMLVQVIINQSNGSINKFIISIKTSMESVTLYSVGIYIYNTFSSITTKPISIYLPQVAKDMGAGLKGMELTKTLIRPARLVALIGGTIFFGFIAVGKQFIHIIYGASYDIAWLIAIISIAPAFVNMTGAITVNVIDILNKRHVRSGILAITLLLNIALSLVLIDVMGIIGTVIAGAISMIIGHLILQNLYYYKAIGINMLYLYKEAYRGIVPTLVVAAAVSFLVASLIKNDFVAFLVGGILFVAIEFFGIIKLKSNRAEKDIVMSFVSKLKRKTKI